MVLLSAYSQRELVERAREAGVVAYLVKPYREEELTPAIEVALARFARVPGVWRSRSPICSRRWRRASWWTAPRAS